MYSCCVTDANGCSICDSVEVSYAIGLIEETTMGLTLIPNPFSSQLILESIFNDVSYNRLRMCDITGRVVYEELNLLSKKIIIPTEAMNPGIYFISVEGNFGRKYFKVMKQ